MDSSLPAPLSMRFPRQDYWSELPFLSPDVPPNLGIKTVSPQLAGKFFTAELSEKPFSSIQFSCSVVSNSLRPHELQHTRPPCPSPTPGIHSNSCPSSRCCHPVISPSVIPFFSCPQIPPASVSSNQSTLRMRWPKYWNFSFSIIPSKEIPGLISFRMEWLDLLAVQGTLKSLQTGSK